MPYSPKLTESLVNTQVFLEGPMCIRTQATWTTRTARALTAQFKYSTVLHGVIYLALKLSKECPCGP